MIRPRILRLYDPHHFSLPTWLLNSNKDTVIIHIDSHFDVNGWSESRIKLFEDTSIVDMWSQAAPTENPTRLGLYGIEDFFYPIFSNKNLRCFYWLTHTKYDIKSVRTLIRNLYKITEDDYKSWKSSNGILEGNIYGCDVKIINMIEQVKYISDCNYILDIDLDYFINEKGELWSDPYDLIRSIDSLSWSTYINEVNVCSSVDGGYTPKNKLQYFKKFINQLSIRSSKVEKGPEPVLSNEWNNLLYRVMYKPKEIVISDLVSKKLGIEYPGEYQYKIAIIHGLNKNENKYVYNLNEAIEICPNHVYALYKLGMHYFHNSNYQKAKDLFDKVVDIYPEDHKAISMSLYTEYLLYGIDVKSKLIMRLKDYPVVSSLRQLAIKIGV